MRSHFKKMIAPILVTAIMIAYFIVYFLLLVSMLDGVLKYIFGIVPLVISAATVAVCIERIKEIKKGEEDDISKY